MTQSCKRHVLLVAAIGFFASCQLIPDLVPSSKLTNPNDTANIPGGLTAKPGESVVSLTWNSVSVATGYNIYRSAASGTQGALLASTSTNGYNDSSVTNGTTYYYEVTAYMEDGAETSPSRQVSATPQKSGPTSPSVSIGAQNGALTTGIAGTATFAVTTSNIASGTSGAITTWYTDQAGSTTTAAPAGISAAVSNVISNSSTATITTTAAAAAGSYYFSVTFGSASSPIVTLTISPTSSTPSVSIGTQAGALTTGTAGTVTFSVTTANIASGTSGTITWYSSISGSSATTAPAGVTASASNLGATYSSTVTITTTSATAAGSYYLSVTYGATSSSIATLTIGAKPTVSAGAQQGTLTAGTAGSATFAVSTANIASGASGTIAWYSDASGTSSSSTPSGVSAAVSNVASNASTVTVTTTASSAAGSYYFEVSFGATSSAIATLTIGAKPTVSIGTQQGTLTAGTAGSAIFAATTTNVAAGTTGTVTWYTSSACTTISTAPKGITATVSAVASNAVTVTMAADATAIADSYYFTLDEGTAVSSVATLTVSAPISIAMVSIPTGSFNNGTSTVTLSAFSMSKYDITQSQYQAITGNNPSNFSGNSDAVDCPVEMATWYDAVEFCNKLSTHDGLTPVYAISDRTPSTGYPITSAAVSATWTNNGYRLPTEAQWEYACRAGTTSTYYWGEATDDTTVGQYAWFASNSSSTTHAVGQKLPNVWGLYDMAGNVWQWCWDWYDPYPSGAQTDPTGPSSGAYRLGRGGSWYVPYSLLTSASRDYGDPYSGSSNLGFRVVRSAPSATVTLGDQTGKIVSGIAGSASFAATTSNVAAATAGTVTWYSNSDGTTTTAAPTGLTPSVSAVASDATTVTMTADTTAVAGTYYFKLTEGTAVSAVAELDVSPSSPITISIQLAANQALSFSPSSVTIAMGQSLTFTPSFASGGTDWQWYVNGVLQTTQTTSTLSYAPSAPGFYTIYLGVQYDGVWYSGSATATVTQ